MRRGFAMAGKTYKLLIVGAVLALTACAKGTTAGPGGFSTIASLPGSAAPSASPTAPPKIITVSLGETDATHMFIKLSSDTAAAGKVTFVVTNDGTHKHEFVVLQTDTPAANFPIGSFEGEKDRIDEDTAGTNVGETGDMEPGDTKALVIDMKAGHHAVVCNLPGHYRMGMHEDFTVA
jgi:uncharacterized cupredoxin-like copper-binding protein